MRTTVLKSVQMLLGWGMALAVVLGGGGAVLGGESTGGPGLRSSVAKYETDMKTGTLRLELSVVCPTDRRDSYEVEVVADDIEVAGFMAENGTADVVAPLYCEKGRLDLPMIEVKASKELFDDGWLSFDVRITPTFSRFDAHASTFAFQWTQAGYVLSSMERMLEDLEVEGAGDEGRLVFEEASENAGAEGVQLDSLDSVRGVYGIAAFWDTRSPRPVATGAKVTWCDTTDTTCTQPWDPDCCFKAIPRADIELWKCDEEDCYVVDETSTDYGGAFYLEDADGSSEHVYWLKLIYSRTGYPTTMTLKDYNGNVTYRLSSFFLLTQEYMVLSLWSVNSAGDTTSAAGDYASVWRTAHDACTTLEDEGETALRAQYGSANAYDLITVQVKECGSNPYSTPGSSYICIDYGTERLSTPAHELGHNWHYRALGDLWPYVASGDSGWNWDGAEGSALQEAIASFLSTMTWWDTDTASVVDVESNTASCVSTASLSNTNDASVSQNNFVAMWDLVDTSTAGSDSYSDQSDLTANQLMLALELLMNEEGDEGDNRTGAEQYFVVTATDCTDTEDCAHGDICAHQTSKCLTGDVHGDNLRDWVYFIPEVTSESMGTSKYWQTMAGCPCMGLVDDSWPFDGGYRTN